MSKLSFPLLIGLVGVLLAAQRAPLLADGAVKAKERNDWLRAFYQRQLRAMKEPSLSSLAEKDREATVYRILWLPSFENPVAVRFVKTDEGGFSYAVRLDSQGGYEPGNVAARKTIKLGEAHWRRIAGKLEKARFWTLPTNHRPPFGRLIDDGDIVIIEGVSGGNYHLVVRNNPLGGDFVDLCRAMLFMSGIDVRKTWFQYRR